MYNTYNKYRYKTTEQINTHQLQQQCETTLGTAVKSYVITVDNVWYCNEVLLKILSTEVPI